MDVLAERIASFAESVFHASICVRDFQKQHAIFMNNTHEQPDTQSSWGISLAFWLTLLVSISVYSLVALSPKLLTYIRLRHDFNTTQVRLVGLEHEVEDLDQVIDSLTHDPDFLRKHASVEFGARRVGEERIPVDPDLQLSIRDNDPVFEIPADSYPWYGSLIRPFAETPRLRGLLLLASGMALVLAFTFLQERVTAQTK